MRQHEVTVSQVRAKTRFPKRDHVARLASGLVLWTALAAPLHFAWEWAHAPLYALWLEESKSVIAYSIAHCTAGDAVIAGVSYLAGVAYGRAVDWPNAAPLRGAIVALLVGVGYTAFSEWFNVYRLGSWSYTDSMPLVAGIGVTPLLQWLFVPLATVFLWRRLWPGGPFDERYGQRKENTFNNGGDA